MGVSTSEEVDEGLCPFDPCELLKKLDQNFSTCNSPLFFYSTHTAVPLAVTISIPLSDPNTS